MSSHRRTVPLFVRDTAIAAVVFALVLAPLVYDIGPAFLRYPGYLLYIPFLFAYILLGGETEGPFGPSTVHVGLYVLVLGIATASVAHFLRTRYDVSGLGTLRSLLAGVLTVGGTLAVLIGLLDATGFVFTGLRYPILLVVLGGIAVGGAIVLVRRE